MKLSLVHILLLQIGIVLCINYGQKYNEADIEIKEIIFSMENILHFVDKYYDQINLDGVLGITLAQAQIEQVIDLDRATDYFTILKHMMERCQDLKKKIIPLLPDEPEKNKLFKDFVLDSGFWYRKIEFGGGRLKDLGIYENWTLDYILSQKEAEYNGAHADVCLAEVLRENYEKNANKDCYISIDCLGLMLGHRTDTMYMLTNRLLYLQMARQTNCRMGDVSEELIEDYCSLIWTEAKTNEFLEYPQHDIFLEGVTLCGMEGFEELMIKEWRREIRNWQTEHGCYTPLDSSISFNESKSTNVIEFGCGDHTTGFALASLATNLRYIFSK